jgi:hypothetical protein
MTRSRTPYRDPVSVHVPSNPIRTEKQIRMIDSILLNRRTKDPTILRSLISELTTLGSLPGSMENIPAATLNATAGTCLQMANQLNMDPSRTIWSDFGCGGLCFGIQGSLFNLQTWCLDLPGIMQFITQHVALMSETDKTMVMPLNLVAGDIGELRLEQYGEGFSLTTHLTIFIGIHEGSQFDHFCMLTHFV